MLGGGIVIRSAKEMILTIASLVSDLCFDFTPMWTFDISDFDDGLSFNA